MSNVSAAFPQAKKLLLSSEKVVCELTESLKVEPLASSGSFQGLDQLEHTASSSVNQLLREVQHLHLLLQRESGSRRQAWASRIDSLSAQATCVRGDLERYFLNRNREELFGPRYRTETIQDHARTSAEMSHAEQNSLARSIQNVDGMTAIASTALESLRSQRRRLKVCIENISIYDL